MEYGSWGGIPNPVTSIPTPKSFALSKLRKQKEEKKKILPTPKKTRNKNKQLEKTTAGLYGPVLRF
jgi:hypothetical protein